MPLHDSKQPPLPPAIKRLGHWFWLPAIVAALGVTSLLFKEVSQSIASLKFWGAFVVPAFFFVPQFIAILAVWLGNRRVKAKYIAAKGRLCTSCTYSLLGLPDQGHCPECAAPYDIIADAPGWERAQMPAIATPAGLVGMPVG
ncbi:MAG: hypothetical protein AABZ53_02735 [Planctomycetota bacterium]